MATQVPDQPDVEAPADDNAPSESRSRRSFIFFGALAAASAVSARTGQAQIGGGTRQRPRRPAVPQRAKDPFPTVIPQLSVAAPASWASNDVRLVRRITMGVRWGNVLEARGAGYQGYLHRQLNHTRIEDSACDTFVAEKYPLLAQTGDQIFNQSTTTLFNQLDEATIYRAAFSKRQLYERMVEFWSDHFNILIEKVGYLKLLDDRDVIRKHALGKVGDIVRASSKSAAMLAYLDQNVSRVGRLNENYARELMELHTLGVDGGYTQTDVAELARVLTGWTIAGRGNFSFNPSLHDWGAKTVMGVNIPAGSPSMGQLGMQEGEQMITFFLNHANTARFISMKMLKWLLTAEPSDSQITAIASVYKATNGDIKSMVRAILNSTWLPAAPLKFKRPFHFLVSALRSLNPTVTSLSSMNSQLFNIGQPIFDFETPDGYPDAVDFWAGNILPRWTCASTLSTQTSATTINVDITRYTAGTADAALDLIDQEFFGGELDAAGRALLLNYLRGVAFPNTARMRETLALAMSSSRFQWY